MNREPGARRALALLLTLNLFCYLDRYILSAVTPEIQKTFFSPDDPQIDFKTGLLGTVFLVSYMVLSPLFGVLADRYSRWKIIAIGAGLWSLATSGSGWAPVFGVLLVSRMLVGAGEAAYGPAAPTILADLYPKERRGYIMAWFFAAIPVGSAIGYLFGGTVGTAFGWRAPFHYAAIPGLILAALCLFMKEPQRRAKAERPKLKWSDYAELIRIPSYVYNVAAQTAMTFAIGGMSFWAPKYFIGRPGAGSLDQVNLIFGGVTAVAGLGATLFGGWLADTLAKRVQGAYFWVSGCGIMIAFPCTLAMLWAPFPLAWVLCFLAVFFLFFNIGPANTAIANVTSPAVRASAFAVNIFVIHALGDAISPPLIGLIADYSSMTIGFVVVSFAMFIAGLLWIFGARHLETDSAKISDLPGHG